MNRQKKACRFIKKGRAVRDFASLRPADIICIATPDDQISNCVKKLRRAGAIKQGTIVFHCSGTWSSAVLKPLAHKGALVASVHPLKTFAAPKTTVSFSGTYCSIEGDRAAKKKLCRLFESLGAKLFEIDRGKKRLYHAAAVFACNYLLTMVDAALKLFEESGVGDKQARLITKRLVGETMSNLFKLGTKKSLTGPAARGDLKTVRAHHNSLREYDRELALIYKLLAKRVFRIKQND